MATNEARAPRIDVRRSQLAQMRGLGAARSGVHAWWIERVTSIALVPLTIWFVVSVLGMLGTPRAGVLLWAANPINTVLLLALVISTFVHMAHGLQVVVEDYVHAEAAKTVSLLLIKAVAWLLGLAAFAAVLHMGF